MLMEAPGPFAVAHCVVVTREAQVPVNASIVKPGLLSIFETVTVAVPLLIALTVNQTVLFGEAGPQDRPGSVPTVVALMFVALNTLLLAHRNVGVEQLSFNGCASAKKEVTK